MPSTSTPPANPISERMHSLSSRLPGLTPMERQLLEQVAQIERESRARDVRHMTEVAQLKTELAQLTTEITPLKFEVAQLRMQLASSNGTISRLTIWLGALLGPEAPSGS